MKIIVTVGMGPWPFDRLLHGVAPLCAAHEVFVQTGASRVVMPCESKAFVAFEELLARLTEADLVITHAGNTVRLVQRQGKLPLACAREARRGEMANDHQVAYLRHEEALGRVVAAWDPDDILRLVDGREGGWRLAVPLPQPSAAEAARRMSDIWAALRENPFSWKAEPQLAYFWEELAFSPRHHLHLGLDADALGTALHARCGIRFEGRPVPRPKAEAIAGGPPYDSISVSGEMGDDTAASALLDWAWGRIVEGGVLVLATPAASLNEFAAIARKPGFEPIRREFAGPYGFLTIRRGVT